MTRTYPFLLAGELTGSEQPLEVRSPYSGEVVGVTSIPSAGQVESAVAAAVEGFQRTRRLSSEERARILVRIRDGLAQRREEFARIIALEAGKPIKDASTEVERALHNLEVASEEAKRIGGEILPLDQREHSRGRIAFLRRYPIGPIAAISPFNFPLNLPLHKLGPAIASGNTIVLKPAAKTPLTVLALAQVIAEADAPPGAVSILPISSAVAEEALVREDRFKMLTFTGSAEVGWRLKALAGKKKVTLELGGNAAVIVDRDAGLEFAVRRIAQGGYSYAGQSCISVQRVYVHADVFDSVSEALTAAVKQLKVGDPLDPETDVGPLIDLGAAQRTEGWVREAVSLGARLLVGGEADGPMFQPTVLAGAPEDSAICRAEAFAPVTVLLPFSDFKDAVARTNDSPYGLQAGVFTGSLENALYAFDELEVGGVIVNDVPTYRADPMPYGGVKDSGLGREGPRYAIEEMTEPRLMVVNRL
ncbi:MAG: aldehyde dehydrogenase family protein [Dehalococcoidia bacterium]